MISKRRRRVLSCAYAVISLLSFMALMPSVSAMDENAPASQSGKASQPPALLVLLLDSLRWDTPQLYTKRSNGSLPGFTRLASAGAVVDEIRPVFPAECFPNIFSMFSGRYPSDHGAIFNDLYNETDNATYSFQNWTGHEKPPNLGIDQLFNADLTKNKRVHLFNLPPGCSHPVYAGVYCEEVPVDSQSESQMNRLNQTLEKAMAGLRNGSADMAVVYFDELDRVGHRHGPLSDELLLNSLPKLDQVINDLMSQLDASPTPINLLVTSDHGMTDVKSLEYLDRTISPALVKKVINRGSTVSIWPLSDKYDKVYFRLMERSPGIFTVYNRTNLPADWRTGGPFFPPILLVNRPGVFTFSTYWPFSTEPRPKGLHGYLADLPDMRVPLFVYGPSVRPGSQVAVGLHRQPVDQLHTHVLINHMLGLQPPASSLAGPSGDDLQLHRLLMLQPAECCVWPSTGLGRSLATEYSYRLSLPNLQILAILIIASTIVVVLVSYTLTVVCAYLVQRRRSSSGSEGNLTEKLLDPDDALSV